jgi:uncharacterized protein (TIGR02757 family)
MEHKLRNIFEQLYEKYNRREYVSPDPLQFLYDFDDFQNIEIVGLISSSLAYGNVKVILKSINKVLEKMSDPKEYILTSSLEKIREDFKNFKHRFTNGEELSNFLFSIKEIYNNFGSLYNIFFEIYTKEGNLVDTVKNFFGKYFKGCPTLIPNPFKNSSCKRIYLFLRWMVRKDNVDLGIWEHIDKSKLIVPLDTHLFKISKMLKLTNRKNTGIKTAIEITSNFSKINKEDPVKYDFVLTRFGIRKMGFDFFEKCV